jgi:hypothetical protein
MRGPSFMAIDDIEALDRALNDVSPEAAGAAFKLMVKTFIRGKAFADDEAAARALHLQARRLCRVKDQFGELFEMAAELVTKARQRLECRGKSKLNENLRPKNSAKSTAAVQMKNPISPEEGDIGRPDVRENAPSATPTNPPPASRKRPGTGKKRPKPRRTWPPKAPLPDDWTPTAADVTHAMQEGYDHVVIAREAQSFADYYAAHGTRLADIGAAWRRWVDRIDDFKPRGRREPPSIAAAILAGCMSVARGQTSYG